MRIVYVARFDQSNADDEGAVEYALRLLGHEVYPVREQKGRTVLRGVSADLLLFHHWDDHDAVAAIARKMPAVFWYFDLVDWPRDETLEARNRRRRAWVTRMTEVCAAGFLTDGDWVSRDRTGKLHWLPQGVDGRIAGSGTRINDSVLPTPPRLLYVGCGRSGGRERGDWVDRVTRTYGPTLRWVQKGLYRRELADAVTNAVVVLAPPVPVTDRYWSNRVYNTVGLGGFMLHPFSRGLAEHYADGEEVAFYLSEGDMHEKVARYLGDPVRARSIAEAGVRRTLAHHTYLRRVAEMLSVLKEKGVAR